MCVLTCVCCQERALTAGNVLYNRGIAFITYESEHNASFAKEAMSNQSLDSEEVLNVRWATEDPNPTEKIEEQKRMAEEGQKTIKSMLDDKLIEASQALRALEDGDEQDFYPIQPASPSPEPEERPAKKARNDGGAGETALRAKANGNGAAAAQAPSSGLLSGAAMDNIRYYAELARKQAEEERENARKAPAKPAMSALLGGYDSGDDSE